jgi:hypothetical protein
MIAPVLVPCGPGPLEFDRLVDFIDALYAHEKEAWLVIVNDNNPGVSLASLRDRTSAPSMLRVDIFPNPRNGRGWGWSGGLVLGELAALRFIGEKEPNVPFVVKADTDALCVAPFAERLVRLFSDNAIGLAGSRIIDDPLPAYKTTAPLSYFREKTEKMMAWFALWRKPNWHLRSALWDSRTGAIREVIIGALRSGYQKGELIEGGVLGFSGSYVRALCASDMDRQEDMLLHLNVSDDLFLTPLAYYFGLRAVESPLFCVEPASLRYPPPELMEKCPEAAWVHSLKGPSPTDEPEARRFFQQIRDRNP